MTNKSLLTVLTPTYNRARFLRKLYASLLAQTNKNFIWLIIDDGSEDETKELIAEFVVEKKIKIDVVHQQNSGKYVAHNCGVKCCKTELIVCVDSDDQLYSYAVERTLDFWEKWKNDPKVAGIVSPKDMKGGTFFINPPLKTSLMDLYNNYHITGETMLVFRTDVLRQYLFPEVKGEKFMSECVIYNQIDQKYVLAVQNEYLYKAEYQEDGLTKNINSIYYQNPQSTLIMYRSQAAYQKKFMIAMKSYAAYLAWRKAFALVDYKKYNVKLSVKLAGALFKSHYYKRFKHGKEDL